MINIEYLDEENNGLGCLTTLTTDKRRGQDKHKYHRCPIPLIQMVMKEESFASPIESLKGVTCHLYRT